tara:strand:+ start:9815 stop:10102 length:288 start_codon:yes stop_codon:yes gene_type:complete
MKKQSEGLWANIWAKRRAGKKMRKKGEKGAPTPDAIRSAQGKTEDTTTASIPNPADTSMGPRIKSINVTDRRRKKSQVPMLLKRFRKYAEETEMN